MNGRDARQPVDVAQVPAYDLRDKVAPVLGTELAECQRTATGVSRTGSDAGRNTRIESARGFASVIHCAGAELIVHGHSHRLCLTRMEGPRGLVPVVGVPSASVLRGEPHHRAGYHLFEIFGDVSEYKIAARARGLLPGTAVVGDLGPLAL